MENTDVANALKALEQKTKEEQQTESTPENKVEIKACERCGFHPEKKELSINEKDKQEYLRCLLGMRSFTKTFELYDGALKIKFQSMNTTAVDFYNELLRKTEPLSQEDVIEAGAKLKLLFLCRSIQTEEKLNEYELPTKEIVKDKTINALFIERFGEMPEMIIQSLVQTNQVFQGISSKLVKDGLDTNFWKGAGLDSQ